MSEPVEIDASQSTSYEAVAKKIVSVLAQKLRVQVRIPHADTKTGVMALLAGRIDPD